MVPHLTGPPSHWSAISLVPHLIGPPISTHAPPIPLVPHLIGPFSPAGPPIHKSPPLCLNSIAPFSFPPRPLVTISTMFSLPPPPPPPPPPMSPNATLVIQLSLVPHFIGPPCNPFYPVLIGPPSHWSPCLTLSTLFSLVLHLIGPPI